MSRFSDLTDESTEKLEICLPDLPDGSLNIYRSKATFDWKRMRLYTFGYDTLEFQVCIIRNLFNEFLLLTTVTNNQVRSRIYLELSPGGVLLCNYTKNNFIIISQYFSKVML